MNTIRDDVKDVLAAHLKSKIDRTPPDEPTITEPVEPVDDGSDPEAYQQAYEEYQLALAAYNAAWDEYRILLDAFPAEIAAAETQADEEAAYITDLVFGALDILAPDQDRPTGALAKALDVSDRLVAAYEKPVTEGKDVSWADVNAAYIEAEKTRIMPEKQNDNCLAGMKCPTCGSLGPFWISATISANVLMADEGTVEEKVDDTSWQDDSITRCAKCQYEGLALDFKAAIETDIEKV